MQGKLLIVPLHIYETIFNKILAYQTLQCTENYLSQPDGHPSQISRADLTLKKIESYNQLNLQTKDENDIIIAIDTETLFGGSCDSPVGKGTCHQI